MDVSIVAPLSEQDIREHKLLARIDALEAEVAQLEILLWQATEDAFCLDPIAEATGSLH